MNDVSSRILAGLLEARTGQQLAMSRRWRIETALKSLMRDCGIASLDQLIIRLVAARDTSLSDQVVQALLNNETFFFRDRASFDLLLKGVLPRLRAAREREKKLSIWCAGCSTGQEVYSIAMSFAEDKLRWHGWTIELLGTDISGTAIERAREGIYSQFEVQRGLPVVQMMRWFEELEGQRWQVSRQLRDMIRFQGHNLNDPPPQPRSFDIILCRNVLLYFPAEAQRAVFANLAAACAPGAALMLGAGETIIGQTNAFEPDPDNRGLYIRGGAEAAARTRVAWAV